MATYSAVLLFTFPLFGIWPLETKNKFLKTMHNLYRLYVFFIELFSVILKIVYTYFMSIDIDLFAESLFESIYILILFLEFYIVIMSRDKFVYILNYMKENFVYGNNEFSKAIVNGNMNKIKVLFIVVGSTTVMTYIFSIVPVVIPEFADRRADKYWNKTNPERKMLNGLWFPFDETVAPYYYITLFANLSALLICFTFLFIFTVLLPTVLIEIGSQFEIIAALLEYKVKKSENIAENNENCNPIVISSGNINNQGPHIHNDIKESDYVQLKKIILCHQQLLQFFKIVSDVFRPAVVIKSSFLTFAVCLSTYHASVVPAKQIFRPVLYFLDSVIELFVFCWFSEQLTHQSLQVYRAVYFSNWYNCSEKEKKTLNLIATRAKNPVKLELLPNFIAISLENFITVLKTSYSAYTLIKSFKKESQMSHVTGEE